MFGCLSVSLFVCLCGCLTACDCVPLSVNLLICVFVYSPALVVDCGCLCACLFVCLLVCMSVCLFNRMFGCLFVRLCGCFPVWLFVCFFLVRVNGCSFV